MNAGSLALIISVLVVIWLIYKNPEFRNDMR